MKKTVISISLLTLVGVLIGASEEPAIATPGATCYNICPINFDDPPKIGEGVSRCNRPGVPGNDWMNSCTGDEWCYYKNPEYAISGVCLKVPGAQNNEQGCCSYHGGVSYCQYDNHVICKDGTISPSCMCR